MYKTIVKFTDEEGNSKEKELRFNLTKAEIAKLQLSTEGGFDKHIQAIIDSKDNGKIIELFENLITMSYGQVDSTGEFYKDKDAARRFLATEAYSELFMRLITDEKEQQAFFMGIIPRDLASQVEGQIKANNMSIAEGK